MTRTILSITLAGILAMAPAAFAMEMEKGAEGDSKLHFHGYGELHYNLPSGDPAKMDAHRMVWGLSYNFTDKISVHTEVDFEHAAQEMEMEYAYLDFLVTPAFNFRTGTVLMPVGPLNEFHEPTLFYSVERPNVEKTIIPTTWQEGGFGIFGSSPGGFKYRLYMVSSLNGDKFSAKDGIRKGRGKVNDAPTDDLATVGRLEYAALAGLDLGLSIYQGGANVTKSTTVDPSVGITEADIRFRKAGADIRVVHVTTKIDDAANTGSNAKDDDGNLLPKIGEEVTGMYAEIAYWMGHVVPFARIEQFNTQDKAAPSLTADPKFDKEILTLGLAYYPHPNVALKADWSEEENGKGATSTQTNLGVAYMF